VDTRTQPGKLKVVVASDHALLREGLRKLLDTDPNLLVVGEAGDTASALTLVTRHTPHLLLLDWALPRERAIGLLRRLASNVLQTAVRVIILSESVGSDDIQLVLELGARGLVFKDAGSAVLVKAIHAVGAGQYWVARESLATLVQLVRDTSDQRRNGPQTKRPFGLTPREFEIMCEVAAAHANKEIAARFSISEKTVKHHLTNIYGKVGVSSRLELALVAFEDRRSHEPVTASARAR
jgi:DNA-binding NarL/FixJ family response regulator